MQPGTDLSLVEIVVHRTFSWYPRTLVRSFNCYRRHVATGIDYSFVQRPRVAGGTPPGPTRDSYLEFLGHFCGLGGSGDATLGLDRLRLGLLSAHANFAQMDCRVPRHENWISGALESRLAAYFDDAANFAGGMSIWSAGLVGNRETATGADFAIFVGFRGKVVLLVLQAKRTLRSRSKPMGAVDISQRKTGRNNAGTPVPPDPYWQLERLQALRRDHGAAGLVAGYIFYDNGHHPNDGPVLPLIVNVTDIKKDFGHGDRVSVSDRAADLSTVVVEGLGQEPNAGQGDIPQMVAAVVAADPQTVLVITDGEKLVHELSKHFAQGGRRPVFSKLTSSDPGELRPILLPGSRAVSFDTPEVAADGHGHGRGRRGLTPGR